MSFFVRIESEERPSVVPSLPQSSSDQASRLAALNEARSIYRFNYTHVSPLAMVDNVPAHDEFSFGWILKVAERAMTGLANLAEIEGDRAARDEHLQKVEKYKFHLHIETDGVGSLRDLVSESLKFEFKIWGEAQRPASIDDYAHMFHTIHLPPVSRDYDQDPVFAAMRLAGPNPVMIQRMTRMDERLPVTDEHLQTICPRDSLDTAIAEGRLYLADYGALDGVECGSFPHGQKYLYAPLALFVVDASSKQFLPVAIQCQQRPAEDNPVFTCRDGFNWLIAKTIVEIADGNVHEAVTHLGRTHILMEPFAVCMFRQLPLHHPVHQLLFPHFQGTFAINRAAWQQLIADRGAVDKLLGGTIQESRRLAVESVQSVNFDEVSLPVSLAQRGVVDTTCLPSYPYRDDAGLYWDAIHAWLTNYLALYYRTDSDVAEDRELQAWYTELQSHDGGRVRGMGAGGLGSRTYLIDVLTTIIYTCAASGEVVGAIPFWDRSHVVNWGSFAGWRRRPRRHWVSSRCTPTTDHATRRMAKPRKWYALKPRSTCVSVLTRNRTWSSTFAKSRANPTHSKDIVVFQVPRRGIEPRPTESKSAMPSITLAGHFITHTIAIQEPTTGFAPASTGLQDRRLSQSSHVGNQARARGVEPRPPVLEAGRSPRSSLAICRFLGCR